MKRNDVLRMAEAAGLEVIDEGGDNVFVSDRDSPPGAIFRFAEMLQAEEREACANVCDEMREMYYCVDVREAATRIRARNG